MTVTAALVVGFLLGVVVTLAVLLAWAWFGRDEMRRAEESQRVDLGSRDATRWR